VPPFGPASPRAVRAAVDHGTSAGGCRAVGRREGYHQQGPSSACLRLRWIVLNLPARDAVAVRMLGTVSFEIIYCRARARLAREKGDTATTVDVKNDFLAAEGRWLVLARS